MTLIKNNLKNKRQLFYIGITLILFLVILGYIFSESFRKKTEIPDPNQITNFSEIPEISSKREFSSLTGDSIKINSNELLKNDTIIHPFTGKGIITCLGKKPYLNKGFIPCDFPDDNTPLYDSPCNARIIGNITTNKNSEERYTFPIKIQINNLVSYPKRDFRETGYEETCIVYNKDENGFLQIFSTEYPSLWLKKSDLEKKNCKILSYIDFIMAHKSDLFYLDVEKIYLMEKPTIESKTIITLLKSKKSFFLIELTGKREGTWVEVETASFSADSEMMNKEDFDNSKTKKFKGWIKATNDAGSPLIFYSPKDC